jgi:hypothetical protein
VSVAHGGAAASPLLVRAVELLEDGKWHDLDKTVRELSRLVPPGRAIRRAEQNRAQASGTPTRTRQLSHERLIASGARSIAREVMRPPHFEIDPPASTGRPANTDDGRKRVRLVQVPPRVERDRQLGRIPAPAFDAAATAAVLRTLPKPDLAASLRAMTRARLEAVALVALSARETADSGETAGSGV